MSDQFLTLAFSALFGAGGIYTIWSARKKDAASVFESMQKAYKQYVDDTEKEMQKLRDEINELRANCDNCTIKTKKKTK